MKYSPKTETEFRKLITNTKIKLYNSLKLSFHSKQFITKVIFLFLL